MCRSIINEMGPVKAGDPAQGGDPRVMRTVLADTADLWLREPVLNAVMNEMKFLALHILKKA